MSERVTHPIEFISHIIHCIQEEHGIELSEKAKKDVYYTVYAAIRNGTSGQKKVIQALRHDYFELKNKIEKGEK